MLHFESQDPLNLRHNENVRKTKERRNQDDEDVSIEVGAEAGTKRNHPSAKAKGIREPKEPHVFPVDEDNYDDSLAKQQQDSGDVSMPLTRGTPGIWERPTIFCTYPHISPLHRYLTRVT